MKSRLVLRLFAIAVLCAAPPAFAKDRLCQFQARGLSMSFGSLDPSSGSNATAVMSAATLNADKAGDCDRPVTMVIDGDGGQNYSGSRRLRNATGTNFIPYTLVGLPITSSGPGNNVYAPFTFSGQILWSSYANAPAGTYSDTVMISVTP
jgi:spore coat protein U-like protein